MFSQSVLLSMALLLSNGVQSVAKDHRALALTHTPTPEERALLRVAPLEEGRAAGLGLLVKRGDGCTFLIEKELWSSASMRLSTELMRVLSSMDASKAVGVTVLPLPVRQQMLNTLNRAARSPAGEPVFDGTTSFHLQWTVSFRLRNGNAQQDVTIDRAPRGSSSAPATASSISTETPRPKDAFVMELGLPTTDAAYWNNFKSLTELLTSERNRQEKELKDLQDALEARLFGPISALTEEKFGRYFTSLPEDIQKEARQQARGRMSESEIEGAEVSNFRESLVLVFQRGDRSLVFTPRYFFDAP